MGAVLASLPGRAASTSAASVSRRLRSGLLVVGRTSSSSSTSSSWGPATLIGVSLGGASGDRDDDRETGSHRALVIVARWASGLTMSEETRAGRRKRQRSSAATSMRRSKSTCGCGSTGPTARPTRSIRRSGGRSPRCSGARSRSISRPARRASTRRSSPRTGATGSPNLGTDARPRRRARRPEMLAIAERLEAEIPNTRRETIPGAAHVPTWSAPTSSTGSCWNSCREPRWKRSSSSTGSGRATRRSGPARTRRTGSAGSTSRGGCSSGSTSSRRSSRDFEDVVLLGMGGSSLAPGSDPADLRASTACTCSTRRIRARSGGSRISSTSSGRSSSRPRSRARRSRRARQLDYFLERGRRRRSRRSPIRAPSSSSSRGSAASPAVFHGEPTIGGRYSALSPFGMVPAALIGVDVARAARARASEMAEACRLGEGNPGLELGLELGEGWRDGPRQGLHRRDAGGFGLWAEQLIAESTGKQGKGLVPAPGETRRRARPPGRGACGSTTRTSSAQEFFRWEFATAVAGSILGINPFDQPDVQAAKDRTGAILEAATRRARAEGSLDELLRAGARGRLRRDPGVHRPGARGRARTARRARARETGCVVTSGLGPRYLHSTGQLHKGGPNTGLFVQVVDDLGEELPIPGQAVRLPHADPRAGGGRLRVAQGARAPGRRVRLEDL